jgi:hypothetical protein
VYGGGGGGGGARLLAPLRHRQRRAKISFSAEMILFGTHAPDTNMNERTAANSNNNNDNNKASPPVQMNCWWWPAGMILSVRRTTTATTKSIAYSVWPQLDLR